MKENVKGILFIVGALVAGGGAYYLYSTDYVGYAIICATIAVILIVFGIMFILNGGDPAKVYESNVRNILNTFDSILVKSNTVPKLIGRNIIIVEEMDDMVDAQLEIRKPICYYKQTESCSFVLLDDKEAYVYVEKLNPEVVSPVEIEINDIKLKQKNSEDLDSEMLKDIEKTTIVKLSNKKSYKVSPIKKENKVKSEEEKQAVDTKRQVAIEDMEIL
jgi:hypothetical protein